MSSPQTKETAQVLADKRAAELSALGSNHTTCPGCGVAISLSQFVFPGQCDICHAYADLAECQADIAPTSFTPYDDSLCTADERAIKGDL